MILDSSRIHGREKGARFALFGQGSKLPVCRRLIVRRSERRRLLRLTLAPVVYGWASFFTGAVGFAGLDQFCLADNQFVH